MCVCVCVCVCVVCVCVVCVCVCVCVCGVCVWCVCVCVCVCCVCVCGVCVWCVCVCVCVCVCCVWCTVIKSSLQARFQGGSGQVAMDANGDRSGCVLNVYNADPVVDNPTLINQVGLAAPLSPAVCLHL